MNPVRAKGNNRRRIPSCKSMAPNENTLINRHHELEGYNLLWEGVSHARTTQCRHSGLISGAAHSAPTALQRQMPRPALSARGWLLGLVVALALLVLGEELGVSSMLRGLASPSPGLLRGEAKAQHSPAVQTPLPPLPRCQARPVGPRGVLAHRWTCPHSPSRRFDPRGCWTRR